MFPVTKRARKFSVTKTSTIRKVKEYDCCNTLIKNRNSVFRWIMTVMETNYRRRAQIIKSELFTVFNYCLHLSHVSVNYFHYCQNQMENEFTDVNQNKPQFLSFF